MARFAKTGTAPCVCGGEIAFEETPEGVVPHLCTARCECGIMYDAAAVKRRGDFRAIKVKPDDFVKR